MLVLFSSLSVDALR